jgi:hypothetical protein
MSAGPGIGRGLLPELAAPQFAVQGRRDTLTAAMSFRFPPPRGGSSPHGRVRGRPAGDEGAGAGHRGGGGGERGGGAAGGEGQVDHGIEEVLVARTASGLVTTKCEAFLEPVTKRH